MASKAEEFIRWYLRFNGYFSIENFIVHAAAVPKRIKGGKIPQDTECDLLGVRLPYSEEIAGTLRIANDPPLTHGSAGLTDLVVCEVKTGKENQPNPAWRHLSTHKEMAQYILQFFGVLEAGQVFDAALKCFTKTYQYEDERCRIRYIIFSNEAHPRHRKNGVTYITYREVINFVVAVRGQSWSNAEIGVASRHQQWSAIIKRVFEMANDDSKSLDQKLQAVTVHLDLS
jgi:hypothetical protein